jgi:acetyltransferase-like isoleucine patch superfamily enzyme
VRVRVGRGAVIQEGVTLGAPSTDCLHLPRGKWPGVIVGDDAVIRSGSVIYVGVRIGNNFRCGHFAVIREDTTIGNDVMIGTNCVIDGRCSIGNNVSLQTGAYVPTNTVIGDNVFIGPYACLTNDKHPVRLLREYRGPILEKGVSVGANAVILPEIKIGEGAIVAAGSVVTKDVEPWTMVGGVPAKPLKPLPADLKKLNVIGGRRDRRVDGEDQGH